MTPGEEEYEYEMEGDAEEEEMEDGLETIKKMSPSAGMKEHLGKLFSGEELSEDFKEKASTVFEAASLCELTNFAPNSMKSLTVNSKKQKQKWLRNLINTSPTLLRTG